MRTIRLLGWFCLCLVGAAAAAGANNPPVAKHDFPDPVHNNGEHFFDVLANDDDPDPGDVIVLSGPIDDPDHPLNDHAVVTKVGSRIKYEAHAGFVGIDTFRYRINDGQDFHSAIVRVEVTANRAPMAVDDEATMVAGPMQSILIDVLEGDSDPDGDPLVLGGPVEDPANPPADHATVVREGSLFRYIPLPVMPRAA